MPKPTIDHNKCNACGICVDICPMSVFKTEDEKIDLTSNTCIGCRACEVQCPKSAIIVND